MRVFQMVMAVLFCAALTFYLWVAVPRVQAQDTSMPVLTDETANLRSALPRRKARIARGCMPKTRMTET